MLRLHYYKTFVFAALLALAGWRCEPIVTTFDDIEEAVYYRAASLVEPPPAVDTLLVMTWNIKFGGGDIDFWYDCWGKRVLMTEEEVLDNLRKGIKVEMTRQTFEWAHEIGMETHAHIMLGSPGERKDTIKRTINFVKEISPSTATFGVCTPYPGTELFSMVVQRYPEIQDVSLCDLRRLHTT